MHPRTKITLWFEDEKGWKWEHVTRYSSFNTDVVIFIENYFDKGFPLFYTVNNETHELDYYNLPQI